MFLALAVAAAKAKVRPIQHFQYCKLSDSFNAITQLCIEFTQTRVDPAFVFVSVFMIKFQNFIKFMLLIFLLLQLYFVNFVRNLKILVL